MMDGSKRRPRSLLVESYPNSEWADVIEDSTVSSEPILSLAESKELLSSLQISNLDRTQSFHSSYPVSAPSRCGIFWTSASPSNLQNAPTTSSRAQDTPVTSSHSAWVFPHLPAEKVTWLAYTPEKSASAPSIPIRDRSNEGKRESINSQMPGLVSMPSPPKAEQDNSNNSGGEKTVTFDSSAKFMAAFPSKSNTPPTPKMGNVRVPSLGLETLHRNEVTHNNNNNSSSSNINNNNNSDTRSVNNNTTSPPPSPRESRNNFWKAISSTLSPRVHHQSQQLPQPPQPQPYTQPVQSSHSQSQLQYQPQQSQPQPQSQPQSQQQQKSGKKKLVRTRSLSSLNKQQPEAPLEWVSNKLLNCTNTLISLGKEAKTNALTALNSAKLSNENLREVKEVPKIEDYDTTAETAAAIVPLETFLRIRVEAQATNEQQLKETQTKKAEVEKELLVKKEAVESLREQLIKAERELQDLERQNELLSLKAQSLSHTSIPKLTAPPPEQERLVCSATASQSENAISFEALLSSVVNSPFDANTTSSVLLTYPVFISASCLVNKLKSKISLVADDKEGQEVNLRICSFFSFWVKNYFEDFEVDNNLLSGLISIIRTLEQQSEIRHNVHRLGNLVAKKLMKGTRREERVKSYRGMVALRHSVDHSISVGVNSGSNINKRISELFIERAKTGFEDSEPLDVSKQLCIIEHRLFCAVKPREFLNTAWNKAKKAIYAPNLTMLMDWFNQFSESIIFSLTEGGSYSYSNPSLLPVAGTEIRTGFDVVKHRGKVLEKWLAIAQLARDNNNFNAVMEILAALDSAPVRKQKSIWELISRKGQITYTSLQQLMSPQSNCSNYRTVLHTCHPPVVPYVGVYLTDLTYLDSVSYVNEDGTLKFNRLQKLANTITEIMNLQTERSYSF
eukprot:TRINITY_DN63_c0_g1_i3.p1 TRINITY_DN63_c0_g1~~TRINITY_DN63_c0_g1_i3.p1  ORF type:complete len:951 (-),score=207.86 TRINITY_DN63_c0_g1_i3:2255-4966(-)